MAKENKDFKDIKEYSGEQVILSSNRLVFNARKDSVLISSRKYINLSAAEKITFDVGAIDTDNEQNMFLVNAPKIQFGLQIKGKTLEPVAKADALEQVLNDILDTLNTYCSMVQTAAITPGPIMAAMLAPATSFVKGRTTVIKAKLKQKGNVKSDVTFTI